MELSEKIGQLWKQLIYTGIGQVTKPLTQKPQLKLPPKSNLNLDLGLTT